MTAASDGQSKPSAVRQAFVYTASNVGAKALAFALIPLLTHLMPAREYGTWGLVVALGNLLTLLLLFGLYVPTSRLYFEQEDEGERRKLYGTLFSFQVLGGGIATGLVHVSAPSIARALDIQDPHVVAAAAWNAYFTTFNLLPLTFMRVREQAARHATVSVVGTLLTTSAPAAAVLLGYRDATSIVTATMAANGLMALVYVRLLWPDIDVCLSAARLRPVLRWSVQFIPTSFANWMLNLSDRLVIEIVIGIEAVAVYTAGYLLASALVLVVDGISNSWLSYYLKTDSGPDDDRGIIRGATLYVTTIAFLALGLMLFGALFVRFALPDGYSGAEPVVVVAALGLSFLAPYLVFTFAVMSEKRSTLLPVVTLACAGVNIGLNVWWLPIFGIVGAAASTLVGYVLLMLGNALLASRVRSIAHDYRRWAIALALAAALGLSPLALPPQHPALEILLRVALLAAFPALLIGTGFVSKEERADLARRLRRGDGATTTEAQP